MGLKTILLTGCGRGGIGAALASHFRLRGHTVFATGRTTAPADLDPALAALGCHAFALDVTSAGSIAAAVQTVAVATAAATAPGRRTKLDLLVNTAGVLLWLPFADTPVEAARRVFEVNVLGTWAVTRAFLPLVLEARGTVVCFGSVSLAFCPPFLMAYTASKAAVEIMARTLRRELAPLGARVVLVKPGGVRTGLLDGGRAALPEDSLYAPLRADIEGQSISGVTKGVMREEFARMIGDEVLQERPRAVIWRGSLVWIGWFLSWLGWETMLVGRRFFERRGDSVLTLDRTGSSSKVPGSTSFSTKQSDIARVYPRPEQQAP